MARQRLRKAEETIVDAAVAAAVETVRPHLLAIEQVVRDTLVPAVGTDLASEANRRFLNAIGRDLWAAGELAAILAAG